MKKKYIQNKFGKYIRKCRNEMGISLRTAASTIGVSSVYLWEVEVGKSAPMMIRRWDNLIEAVPILSRMELKRLYMEYYINKGR